MKARLELVRILRLPHPLTSFEIQKYCQNDAQLSLKNELKSNGVYSRYSLPKIKNRAYVINLDELKSITTHRIALYVNGNNVIYFDSFGVEQILKQTKTLIGNKNIITNIYRIQAYGSIIC